MRPVKTRPKFRCDFCKKTGVRWSIEAHEPICWNNPDRYCPNCKNTGETVEDYGDGLVDRQPCYFCKQRNDPEKFGGAA